MNQFKSWFITNINTDYAAINSSSLFVPLKLFLCRLGKKPLMEVGQFLLLYNIFTLFMAGFLGIFAWREKIFWKRIMFLIFFMLLVPQLIWDYKLIYLLLPLWLFIEASENSRFDRVYAVLFGLLFIPKHVLVLNPYTYEIAHNLMPASSQHWGSFSISIIINPLIMLIFMGLLIYEQFLYESAKGVQDEKNG